MLRCEKQNFAGRHRLVNRFMKWDFHRQTSFEMNPVFSKENVYVVKCFVSTLSGR